MTRKTVFKYWISIVLVLVTIILVHNKILPYNLNATLDYYGYNGGDQKLALRDLLHKASSDIENSAFFYSTKEKEFFENLFKMVQEVQDKFVIRQGAQERWEVNPVAWMEEGKEENFEDLKKLGVVNGVLPRVYRTDAVCVLGGIRERMENRLQYIETIMKSGLRPKSIILLTGERYVTKDVDGTEHELSKIAEKFKLKNWQELTEKHLLQDLYDQSNFTDMPLHVLDTPRGELPLTTTYTTIMHLLDWLKDHPEIKNIVFISNQPYVKYQYAIIEAIFREQKSEVSFEVVGSAVTNSDNLQPIIEGLGSYIWAYTPTVLMKMQVQINDPEIKKRFLELYKKHPLIYGKDFDIFK